MHAVGDAERSASPRCVHQVVARDGVALHVREYPAVPAAGSGLLTAPRTLLLVHGAFEHGELYDHAARYFAARGWRVLLPDLRGHGRSGGTAMHVRRFVEYVADLRGLLREFDADPARTALVGNSMGGLATARLIQNADRGGPAPAAAAALCSPLLRIVTPVPIPKLLAGKVCRLLRPRTRFAAPRNAHDPVAAARPHDPLRRTAVTASWFFAVRRAVKAVWKDADRIATPLHVMQSGADRVVCPLAPGVWINEVGAADRSCEVLPGANHEVFQEPDWRRHAARLAEWFETRVPAAEGLAAAGPAAELAPAARRAA
ncbi:alpha/beta fold hydrolase [Alienimonas californiensis]|uniref:Phospholipase YtpA n=1 Tax=Alienimonas californiensis TaxID=2527989 RepID=A0A517PCK9_9PLAN|nr:alpha/beta fold hydrolase [Alienimonas californiensis]QDT17105.1 Phospholipase YtpA [Alienimonas californiensis]